LSKLVSVLNKQIADWTVLYMKLHNYHWYVKGPHFFTLHVKFEELYNEAALHIDSLAERTLTMGGQPIATLKGALELSSIREASGQEQAGQMVQVLADDFNLVLKGLKEGMEAAEQTGDEATGDLLLAIHASVEKHIWMLKAYLG
jgi:starvation-inducible DNA-binding protein